MLNLYGECAVCGAPVSFTITMKGDTENAVVLVQPCPICLEKTKPLTDAVTQLQETVAAVAKLKDEKVVVTPGDTEPVVNP